MEPDVCNMSVFAEGTSGVGGWYFGYSTCNYRKSRMFMGFLAIPLLHLLR